MRKIIVSIVALILIVLIFLFSALKLSSLCLRIDELNNMYNAVKGDDVYERIIRRI